MLVEVLALLIASLFFCLLVLPLLLYFFYVFIIDVNSKCNMNSSDTKKEDRNPITTLLLFVMMEM